MEFLESYYKVSGNTEITVNGSVVRVQLPTFETFIIESGNPDFEKAEAALGISGKLYLYSGEFLTLFTSENSTTRARLISSFLKWMLSDSIQQKSRSYSSWDHATSLRIETFVYLRQTLAQIWPQAGDAVLRNDLEWAMNTENIKLNNHGVFVLRSLLLASKCLPAHVLTGLQDKVAQTFATRMSDILDFVYGTDGWCAENSPMYDRVWINLLRQLQRFFSKQLEEAGITERFDTVLKQADITSRAQLYHGGHYVPRGDSPRRDTKLKPLRGTFASDRVGIWVNSSQNLYLMATAGHSSITHKHVDDLQLLLSYKRVDFFMDAGSAGYDYRDPKIVALKTPAGHSVLSLSSLNELPPWKAYKGEMNEISAKVVESSDDQIVMVNDLKTGGRLARKIVVKQDEVTLTDSWALGEADGRPVVRFLLADTCFVKVTDNSVILMRLGQRLTMHFNKLILARIITGEEKSEYTAC